MGWLFAQLWFWLLVSFLVGSALAVAVVTARTRPWPGPVRPARRVPPVRGDR